MLDKQLKEQLAQYLAKLREPVTLQLALDEGEASRELDNLARELVALSPLITIAAQPAESARVPLLRIHSPLRDSYIDFAAVPGGHEFSSLVLALLHSGGHPPKVDPALRERIEALNEELHFEIFISLSCQTCPTVVQALNLMAALNPRLRVLTIDGALFREEAEDRGVLAVPSVFLNGEPFSQGRIELEDILNKLDQGDTRQREREAAELAKREPYDLVVVGGGPASTSAAIYAARKGLRTAVVAENLGGQVLETAGIDNLITINHTNGPALAANLEEQLAAHEVDLLRGWRVEALKPAREDALHRLSLGEGLELQARSVVIATGARWRQLEVPGEAEYSGRGVAYCPHCDGPLFKDKRVAVVGGGNSGVEAAIDLAGLASEVTLLEFGDSLQADQVLIDKLRSLDKVRVLTRAQTVAIEGDGQRVTGLRYRDRGGDSEEELALDGVFVQIGLLPNTEFLGDTVALNERGEVVTGPRGESSVPGVFAAGDCSDAPFKQIVIAMGSGANAALGAFDWLIRQGVKDAAEAA